RYPRGQPADRVVVEAQQLDLTLPFEDEPPPVGQPLVVADVTRDGARTTRVDTRDDQRSGQVDAESVRDFTSVRRPRRAACESVCRHREGEAAAAADDVDAAVVKRVVGKLPAVR